SPLLVINILNGCIGASACAQSLEGLGQGPDVLAVSYYAIVVAGCDSFLAKGFIEGRLRLDARIRGAPGRRPQAFETKSFPAISREQVLYVGLQLDVSGNGSKLLLKRLVIQSQDQGR